MEFDGKSGARFRTGPRGTIIARVNIYTVQIGGPPCCVVMERVHHYFNLASKENFEYFRDFGMTFNNYILEKYKHVCIKNCII